MHHPSASLPIVAQCTIAGPGNPRPNFLVLLLDLVLGPARDPVPEAATTLVRWSGSLSLEQTLYLLESLLSSLDQLADSVLPIQSLAKPLALVGPVAHFDCSPNVADTIKTSHAIRVPGVLSHINFAGLAGQGDEWRSQPGRHRLATRWLGEMLRADGIRNWRELCDAL